MASHKGDVRMSRNHFGFLWELEKNWLGGRFWDRRNYFMVGRQLIWGEVHMSRVTLTKNSLQVNLWTTIWLFRFILSLTMTTANQSIHVTHELPQPSHQSPFGVNFDFTTRRVWLFYIHKPHLKDIKTEKLFLFENMEKLTLNFRSARWLRVGANIRNIFGFIAAIYLRDFFSRKGEQLPLLSFMNFYCLGQLLNWTTRGF